MRVAIVRAPRVVFAARGFDGTALQEIADAARRHQAGRPPSFPFEGAHPSGSARRGPRALAGDAAAPPPRGRRGQGPLRGGLRRALSASASDADRARHPARVPRSPGRGAQAPRRSRAPLARRGGRLPSAPGKAGGRHHADLDPDAYVVNILSIVISLTATGPRTPQVSARTAVPATIASWPGSRIEPLPPQADAAAESLLLPPLTAPGVAPAGAHGQTTHRARSPV